MEVQFAKTWHVKQPPVYRFLERKYVDDFFETGHLRLSCVSVFRQHDDEQRWDDREGKFHVEYFGRQFNGEPCYINVKGEISENGYVLCGAMTNDARLMEAFGCDAYICITDTIGFAQAVAHCVPGFLTGYEGPCIYNRARIIQRGGPIPPRFIAAAQSNRAGLEQFVIQNYGPEILFLKHQGFLGQAEYRLIWLTDRPVTEPISIYAPQARAFCFSSRFDQPPSDGPATSGS
jgi:hypothetical protein